MRRSRSEATRGETPVEQADRIKRRLLLLFLDPKLPSKALPFSKTGQRTWDP